MKRILWLTSLILLAALLVGCSMNDSSTSTSRARDREIEARKALEELFAHTPGAKTLAKTAEAILIFPDLTKAGFVVGGQYGEGVLFREGQVAGFYSSKALSYGLQAGVQRVGYAMFFMSKDDLDYLKRSEGWEVGVGPTITLVDEGFAKSITTTTGRKGVYVFFFAQRGLMAGLGLQGTHIKKIDP